MLDLERGCVLAAGREIVLRPKSFDFLRYLAANPGRLILKEELLAAIWPNMVVTDDSVVQCVTEIRRALGDHGQRIIRTVQRRGYRFEAVVDRAAPQREAANLTAESKLPAETGRSNGWLQAQSLPPRVLLIGAFCVLLVLGAAVLSPGLWPSGSSARPATPPALSIVVLPFKNLSEDAGQDHFADGVANDLSTELSRLPGMFVIAHATARTLKGKDVDAREVGRNLNVRYLLEGSVRRHADQVRINVQLIASDTGAAVWAERFERRYDELTAWQDEVTGRVAVALNYRLTRLESERGLRERRGPPEATDLTMRGWALVYAAKKPDHYFSARALFQQAIALDAEALSALAGMAWTSAVIVLDGWSASPADDVAAAEHAVAKVLALEPNHFVAHHVRGFLLRMQRRTHAAQDAFRAAVTINPNFAPGYAQLGATELELGRPEAAIAAVERAIRLSPRDPALGPWLAFVGMAKLHLGHYEEAASWLARAIDTGTPIARHHAYLASALAQAGRLEEAREVLAAFHKSMPSATLASLRASARSTEAQFLAQQERFLQGLRLAGLAD